MTAKTLEDNAIKPGIDVTQDAFLEGAVSAFQPKQGYRAGLDAVFLAASIPALSGDKILELGLGSGIAALCLIARVPGVKIAGLELQADLCELAQANAQHNKCGAALDVIEADIRSGTSALEAMGMLPGSFDHVYANPPFYDKACVQRPPDQSKAQAHSFAQGDLETWVKLMVGMAAPKATVTLIHRADKLDEILSLFRRRLGGVIVTPLHSEACQPASRVIVQGIKGSRAPLTLNYGFILHKQGGDFRDQAKAVLRKGEAFVLQQTD
jgi:tRNA1(Val) A37 N6-methylase TrmN6